MTINKSWTWPAAGLACAAALAVGLGWPGLRRAPRFDNVVELKSWAEARGLHCRSDGLDGRVVRALAVSTRPLSWSEVNRLGLLHVPGREGGWKGILWAVNRGPVLDNLGACPWFGECRTWGGILVTGDPDLLDRVERGELPEGAGT